MQKQQQQQSDYETLARQSFQWKRSGISQNIQKGGLKNTYIEIQAFGRKRTLAPQFFNKQQVTHTNNKQFASRVKGGQRQPVDGHSPELEQSKSKSRSPKRDHMNFLSTYQTASTVPQDPAYMKQGVWAQQNAASVQARISVETSNSQDVDQNKKTAKIQNQSISVMSLNKSPSNKSKAPFQEQRSHITMHINKQQKSTRKDRDSDTTSRFVTFQGEQIGNLKMSSLGADDISSKNVTFYGAGQHSQQFNVRSGAVNLKTKKNPGTHIPTSDFDELNKLINGETSQSQFAIRQNGLANTQYSPNKQNFQIYQNYGNDQFNRRGTQQLDEESLVGLRVGSRIINGQVATNGINSNANTPYIKGQESLANTIRRGDEPNESHVFSKKGGIQNIKNVNISNSTERTKTAEKTPLQVIKPPKQNEMVKNSTLANLSQIEGDGATNMLDDQQSRLQIKENTQTSDSQLQEQFIPKFQNIQGESRQVSGQQAIKKFDTYKTKSQLQDDADMDESKHYADEALSPIPVSQSSVIDKDRVIGDNMMSAESPQNHNQTQEYDIRVIEGIIDNNKDQVNKKPFTRHLNNDLNSEQDKTMMVCPTTMNSPTPQLAVMIGHSPQISQNNSKVKINDPQSSFDSQQAKSPDLQKIDEDQEQIILMKILDKMLKKHKITDDPHKVNYLKIRDRQTKDNIERKLIDNNAANQTSLEEMTKGFRKDYVKQIQDHIQEIIKTGKYAKVGTMKAYMDKKSANDAKQANVGVKIAQLKTVRSTMQGSPQRNQVQLGKYNFNDLKSQSNFDQLEMMKAVSPQILNTERDQSLEKIKQSRHSQSLAGNQMPFLKNQQSPIRSSGQNLVFQHQSNAELSLPLGKNLLSSGSIAFDKSKAELEFEAAKKLTVENLTVVTESQQANHTRRNMQDSIVSAEFVPQEAVLDAIEDYHSGFNRHEKILKFQLPVVTKRHIHHDKSTDNERLNDIRRKLRDPTGHMALMEKSALLKQRNMKDSLATIQPSGPSSLEINPLVHAVSGRHHRNFSSQISGPMRSNTTVISPRFSNTDGFLSPIESKYETIKQQNHLYDQSNAQNKKYLKQHKLNMETEIPKPKIKEWIQKDIMLPILGKNKTTLFHSIDQFQEESISYQRNCQNKPFQRSNKEIQQMARQFGFHQRKNTEKKINGQPQKLSSILKQQEKEAQNQQKEQEIHLLKQIEVVAGMMAESKLPQIEA